MKHQTTINNTTMKPVVPIAKRANGFSIESIMRRDTESDKALSPTPSDDSDRGDERTARFPSPDESMSMTSRIPPLHPALPAHVKSLLLGDPLGSQMTPDLLALRTHAWAFGNNPMGAFPSLGTGGIPHPHFHPGIHAGPHVHPGFFAGHREHLNMYPWLMSRPGVLGLPFSGHPDAGLLFHPYRKPKRIRTAFSPSQLLKLEHAFEKNHYVVGQERKELALKLNLTETQVKVWFQNRRTKHKRVRSDDESENGNVSIDDDEIATSSMTYCPDIDVQEHPQTEASE